MEFINISSICVLISGDVKSDIFCVIRSNNNSVFPHSDATRCSSINLKVVSTSEGSENKNI